MIVPLGKWRPDRIPYELNAGDLVNALNVIPVAGQKYIPMRDLLDYSTGAIAAGQQAICGQEFLAADQNYYSIIGTSGKLYRLNPDKSLSDVSNGAYTAGGLWNFAKFGNWIIATDFSDVPQILKGLDTAPAFQALGGSPPNAKYCLFYKGYLILGYVSESGVVSPQKVRYSAIENVEKWIADGETYVDTGQDLADALGAITGLANLGSLFAVFHESSITLGYLVTDGIDTFGFDSNSVKNVGCEYPGSIITVANTAYFWGNDNNIYSFDGSNLTPLGNDIRLSVIANCAVAYRDKVASAYDPQSGIIYWVFPSTGSSDGTPDNMLLYNIGEDRFSLVQMKMQGIFNIHTGGQTFESLASAGYASIEDLPYQLDSAWYQGNAIALAGINPTTGKVALHAGKVMSGTLETGDFSAPDAPAKGMQSGDIMTVTGVRPRVYQAIDPVDVSIGGYFNEGDAVSYSAPIAVDSNGYADVLVKARYLRCKITTGDHGGIAAIDVKYQRGSRW